MHSRDVTRRTRPWVFMMTMCLSGLAYVAAQSPSPLDIYFIDTEGGQATLIVSPSRETLLIDTGFPGERDAGRIAAAATLAGVTRIDQLLITHHHWDHEGGVPDLLKRLPVRLFLDHGPTIEVSRGTDESKQSYAAYVREVGNSPHRVLVPGDQLEMNGVDIHVVTSARKSIAGAGTFNPFCDGLNTRDEPIEWENPQSVGVVLQFRRFRFVDLGDLSWEASREFFCPANRIPPVDLYLSPRHGTNDTPKAEWALQPRVTIMNNGARKGGSPASWQTLKNSPGLEDLWQLHRSVAGGVENNSADRLIANLEEQCEGHYLKASAQPDGSFSIYNSRTNETKQYSAR